MASAAEHRERTRAAMRQQGIDALILGREANVRYVSGANRLWLAGTRGFSPSCVLDAESGAVHLLSITDDGIPRDVPPEHLYPISWNPMNLVGAAAAAAGPEARRVGVDSLSPLFAQLLAGALPHAELVDAEELLRSVRRIKSADDVAAIRAAGRVAAEALAAAFGRGASRDPRQLAGAALERMAALGVTTPAFPPVIEVAGDRVAARVGVLRDGWEGVLARTRPDDAPTRGAAATAVARCRPGATVASVAQDGVSVDGVGLGHEVLRGSDRLEPGLVLYLEAARDGARWGDTVSVGTPGPEVLTSGLSDSTGAG
jgi:Xaa-Pro aminopeptidase